MRHLQPFQGWRLTFFQGVMFAVFAIFSLRMYQLQILVSADAQIAADERSIGYRDRSHIGKLGGAAFGHGNVVCMEGYAAEVNGFRTIPKRDVAPAAICVKGGCPDYGEISGIGDTPAAGCG